MEHPHLLCRPDDSEPLRRRQLLSSDPVAWADVAAEARASAATGKLGANTWWRFERSTEVDCVLATDRLVLCIEGKRGEKLSAATKWLPHRDQVTRNLEAARRLAGEDREFAVLVCVEDEGDQLADVSRLRERLDRSAPHLFPPERDALAARYLGQLSWTAVCQALRLEPPLPETRQDVDEWWARYPPPPTFER